MWMMKRKISAGAESGQAVTEYIIMLVLLLFLVFSLTFLADAVCSQGERMVRIAAYNVP